MSSSTEALIGTVGEPHRAKWQSRAASSGYCIIRIVLGTLLLIASALKAQQLATSPVAENGLLTSRLFLVSLVEAQMALGIWLLAGWFQHQARYVAICLFSTFALFSLIAALSGAQSCNCFGRIPVNPWYTAGLDITAVVALLLVKPPVGRRTSSLQEVLCLAVVIAIAGAPAAVVMASFRPDTLGADGQIIGDSGTIVLEPDNWIGKRCPIIPFTDIGDRLGTGHWGLLFYHSDCAQCHDALATLAASAAQHHDSDRRTQFAAVQVPPIGEVPHNVRQCVAIRCGQLTSSREWFLPTPTYIMLENGSVTRVMPAEELRQLKSAKSTQMN